ncbi:MAG: FHA domain-containing protein [Planctomycetota bacterium]
MTTSAATMFCTNCGKSIGRVPRCPHCQAENEFLSAVQPPEHSFGQTMDPHFSRRSNAAGADSAVREPARPRPTPKQERPAPQTREAAPAPEAERSPVAEHDQSQFFEFGTKPDAAPGAPTAPVESGPVDSGPAESDVDDVDRSQFFEFGTKPDAAPPPSKSEPENSPPADPGEEPDESQFFEFSPTSQAAPEDTDDGSDATQILPEADDGEERTMMLDELESQNAIAGSLKRLSPPDEGALFELKVGATTIGTKNCDICFDRKIDRAVSRAHARIEISPTETELTYTLFDLGSSNGTFHNGERISHPVNLRDKDVVKLGNLELQFLVAD